MGIEMLTPPPFSAVNSARARGPGNFLGGQNDGALCSHSVSTKGESEVQRGQLGGSHRDYGTIAGGIRGGGSPLKFMPTWTEHQGKFLILPIHRFMKHSFVKPKKSRMGTIRGEICTVIFPFSFLISWILFWGKKSLFPRREWVGVRRMGRSAHQRGPRPSQGGAVVGLILRRIVAAWDQHVEVLRATGSPGSFPPPSVPGDETSHDPKSLIFRINL